MFIKSGTASPATSIPGIDACAFVAGMPYYVHGRDPAHQTPLKMTASEIAFVIKQNQEMINFFSQRNAAGDADKVQELQAANENIKLAGLFS